MLSNRLRRSFLRVSVLRGPGFYVIPIDIIFQSRNFQLVSRSPDAALRAIVVWEAHEICVL